MRVKILISDPWDLGEASHWRPLEGDLARTDNNDQGGRGLICLDEPIEHGGSRYRHVVASPRHAGDALAQLIAGRVLLCGLIGISDEAAKLDSALDTGSWRGGLAFTGTVEPNGQGSGGEGIK